MGRRWRFALPLTELRGTAILPTWDPLISWLHCRPTDSPPPRPAPSGLDNAPSMHHFPSGSGWGWGAGAGSSHVAGSNAKKYSKSSVHTGGQAGVSGPRAAHSSWWDGGDGGGVGVWVWVWLSWSGLVAGWSLRVVRSGGDCHLARWYKYSEARCRRHGEASWDDASHLLNSRRGAECQGTPPRHASAINRATFLCGHPLHDACDHDAGSGSV
jgi:hypothetical protein